MPADLRVQQLIEELLDSGSSVEEVCREAPELTKEVRAGWQKLRIVQAQLGELFPEEDPFQGLDPLPPDPGPPRVPGYEVGEVLGRGGVGVVYKAVHLRLNRPVALKMLLAGAFAAPVERERFAREAQVVAGLRHPNIVQVYDVGDLGGRPFFTMEFVEGGSLAEAIAGTPRPARGAAELMATLAEAVEAAHRGGVVHRDLKPSNILLTADGTPRISDFGLARHLESDPALTQSGAVVGTPSYMAPEQALGKSSEIGTASDVYALGAVLYELLTGRPPFRAESAAETVLQVIARDPVPPSRLNARVPRDLETICLKCLRKEPQGRYSGAAALADDLRRFLRGESIAARPEGWPRRLARRIRRRPVLSAGIAAGLLVTLTLSGGALWLLTERASAAQAAAAELAALERDADGDLREMALWMEKSSWPEAGAALERAKGRLGGRGSAGLRRRLEQGARDLELVARLDAQFLDWNGLFATDSAMAGAGGAFQDALQAAGIGRFFDPPEVVAGRIKASNVREALVAALDNCAAHTREPDFREWMLTVARLADEDPTKWRARARASATWKDRAALAEVVASTPIDAPCVPLLLALAQQLQDSGEDPVPFLKRVQLAHPRDFWVNVRLGEVLVDRRNPAESIRFFQAALAVRPSAAIIFGNLGNALTRAGRYEEALEPLQQALRLDPGSGSYHHVVAFALRHLNRHDEALKACELALRAIPDDALLHREYGINLDAGGRHDEAIVHYRRAVELAPKDFYNQLSLRAALLRSGRKEEARSSWEAALAFDPPDHDAWYGHAELCLFLGREDEYRRARSALLAKFGANTDPYIAERTARACLLLPATDDEMRRIVAVGGHAWNIEPSTNPGAYPYFMFARGLADFRLGRNDRAISLMRGDASRSLGPAPQLVLAMALHREGREAEARKVLAAAIVRHDWRPSEVRDQDGWILHALRREAEALILPDLPAFLEGSREPSDNDERLAMLGASHFGELHDTSARLYAGAFAADPGLIAIHRENAARAAAQAGCGLGADASRLGEPERTHWRARALSWLRDELAALERRLADEDPNVVELSRRSLKEWRSDPPFAGVRDPAALEKLPPSERGEWRAFWADVDALLR